MLGRAVLGITVVIGLLQLSGCAAQAGRSQAPTAIDRVVSRLVQTKFQQAGFPATWRSSVSCLGTPTLVRGVTLRCTAFEHPVGQSKALDEGMVKATVSKVTGPRVAVTIQFQPEPKGLIVGPGAMAAYSVQPQPEPGSCHYRYEGSDPLPDPNCTPGAINPDVTQANIASTICRAGYASSIRPPERITEPEKDGAALAYDYTGPFDTAEYDHLVPLELGGDPNDRANLWVEPNDIPNATSTSNSKDELENALNRLVCSREVPLAVAQEAIASNWVAAYAKYVGAQLPQSTPVTTPTKSAPASPTTAAPAPLPTHSTPAPAPPAPPAPTPTTLPTTASPPSGASCQASAYPANDGYPGDYDVSVNSNQPYQTATASDATDTYGDETDGSGHAVIYLWHQSPGEAITVSVGAATCSTPA